MIPRMTWYSLALFSLFAYGMQNFLYKVAAEKKCNTAWVMVAFSAATAISGAGLFFVFGENIANVSLLLWISLVGSATFVAALVLLLLTRYSEQERANHLNFRKGVLLALGSLATAAGATIISKFAAVSFEDFFAFIGISGLFGIVFAFGLKNKLQSERENTNHKNAIIIGSLAGLFNFIGFYAILTALSMGPLSIIAAVHSMNFVIAILLAVLIYKEQLTKRRLAGVGLTVLALVLLRIS